MKKIGIITEQQARIENSFESSAGAKGGKIAMSTGMKSEKGVVLLVVLVLSAVVLAVMTTLIYMITSGTQISGLQKKYKTSLEAAKGGNDLLYQLIGLRGVGADVTEFTSALSAAGLNSTIPLLTSACAGSSAGSTYTGLVAKLMTPSTTWTNCNSSLAIDPSDDTTYDMMVQIGATARYNFYAKIVQTIEGNSAGDTGLLNKSVVSTGMGEITVMPKPYLYAVEVLASSSTNTAERAKLSVLYQY